MSEKQHICLCICTYKRPELLRGLLSKLREQETEGHFEYSIVIVDNDSSESARQTVESSARQSKIPISYYVEPEQNIALARNKALENATGDFIAFIDDDEYPSNTWLLDLYTTFNTYKPNGGVLGPVIPHFSEGTPKWLIKSKICDRPNHLTGTILGWNMTRTGNVLLSRRIFKEGSFLFDKKYGRNGGEDKDLFKRLIAHGYSFIWCHEAEVYEVVYPSRWKLSHYLYQAILRGADNGKENCNRSVFYFMKSLISFLCYAGLLSVSIFMGKHYIYKYLIKVVFDFARVLGCFGIAFATVRHD
ncbi:MAG TPA: glycosyltransferase [Chryseolinea sp.]|nr:glycosyltransferase [Chryseolinea sp.]